MRNKLKHTVLFVFVFLLSSYSNAQESKLDFSDFILIDTIQIDSPVMLSFRKIKSGNKYPKRNRVLIAESDLKLLDNKENCSYENFIKKHGYKIEMPSRFHVLLLNFPDSLKEQKVIEIEKEMRMWSTSWRERSDTIPLYSKPESFKKDVELSKIRISVFFVFLVKVSQLNKWEAIEYHELKGMDNCYLRLAIPAPWLDISNKP